MNIKVIYKFIGRVMAIEALAMLLPLSLALWDKSGDFHGFGISVIILGACCAPSFFMKEGRSDFYAKEGFAIVGLSWIILSFFGGLPYYFSGKFGGFLNCFFESVSGFTTTGITVLYNMESVSRAINLWRHISLFFGGMGILVFTMALLPKAKGYATHIMRAESPGPVFSRIAPKLTDTSKLLYIIYIGLAVILAFVSYIGGMEFFDAICHSLSTIATGGFTTLNAGLSHYNNSGMEWVYIFSMLVSAINFTLIFFLLKREIKPMLGDDEFRLYIFVILISTVLIVGDLLSNNLYAIEEAIRNGAFHVVSIISTTGLAIEDINLWPGFSKAIMTVLMFFGGCMGSTAGGLKMIRMLIMFKVFAYEVSKAIHPREVKVLKMSGKAVNESVIDSVKGYFIVYVFLFMFFLFVISMDGLNFESNFSAVSAAINNVGLTFGQLSGHGSINQYSGLSKIALCLAMLIGRLEIFPILLLFSPVFWKKINI